jgi:hypothetical protein
MNSAVPRNPTKENASRAWIFRLALGGTLIGLSIWGMALCKQLFRAFVGPGSLPTDANFANLGAWVAWILFFGPVAAAGVVTVWSTLRKMGALDQFASWLSERAGRSDESLGSNKQQGAFVSGGDTADPRGLENLSPETVERLQRTAGRTAVFLGGLAGAGLLGIGIFGLVSLLFFSQPYSGSSVSFALAASRLTIHFAVFSGMSVLLGLAILQRTFRKENSSWLLPLRVFTYTILKNRQPDRRPKSPKDSPSER